MKPILEVHNVGKRYKLQHKAVGYLSLRERVLQSFSFTNKALEDFWALQDVSFTVNPGESIGIIGRNGAGKSTLLKILSKITPPSKGRIITRGRIASLLEVGTGFHPELTGRENIFFNGSLLGMKRREIQDKFDEIVDFSGTEKFLDTPLKHYSSGMQLRLAFSVAAFLEPEILVIDEVLAVGDAEFQKKCLGKMEDVSKSGRTILFVSHNMAAVETLCSKAILLSGGQLDSYRETTEVIKLYQGKSSFNNLSSIQQFKKSNRRTYISQIEILSEGSHTDILYMGGDLEIRVCFESDIPLDAPVLGVIIYDALGSPFCYFNNKNYGHTFTQDSVNSGRIGMRIKSLNLTAGFYTIDLHFGNAFEDLDVKRNCFMFQIQYKHFLNAGEPLNERYNKVFYQDVNWTFSMQDANSNYTSLPIRESSKISD